MITEDKVNDLLELIGGWEDDNSDEYIERAFGIKKASRKDLATAVAEFLNQDLDKIRKIEAKRQERLERVAMGDVMISTSAMSEYQVAQAKADGSLWVDEHGYGYATLSRDTAFLVLGAHLALGGGR